MKIFIRDITTVQTKTGPRVRFSVTYAQDNGEPVATERGWTIDAGRDLHLPATRTSFGRYYPMVEASDWLLEKVKAGILTVPQVERVLGPQVVGITPDAREVIEGEVEL